MKKNETKKKPQTKKEVIKKEVKIVRTGVSRTERRIVVPGEKIAEGMDFLPSHGTYRLGENIHSKLIGLLDTQGRVVKVTPLAGVYKPVRGDSVIGQINNCVGTGWVININAAHEAFLKDKEAMPSYSDTRIDPAKFYKEHDVIHTKIINVSNNDSSIHLGMRGREFRKLDPGVLVIIPPTKIPRLIGKQGSMINTVKDATNTRILVGQNGVVHVSGEPENVMKAVRAIKKIDKYAHTRGLTGRIEKMLGDKK